MTTKDNFWNAKLLDFRVLKTRSQIWSWFSSRCKSDAEMSLRQMACLSCYIVMTWRTLLRQTGADSRITPPSSSAISSLLISHPSLCSCSDASPLLRPVLCSKIRCFLLIYFLSFSHHFLPNLVTNSHPLTISPGTEQLLAREVNMLITDTQRSRCHLSTHINSQTAMIG